MSLPVYIEDKATSKSALVSEFGQLVTAPIAYSTSYNRSMALAAPIYYEVIEGKTGKKFVITDLMVITLKTVSPSAPATIIIYEADVSDKSTNLDTIVEIDMISQDRLISNGLNIITHDSARSIVGTTTDGTVTVTIAGYYIPVE